MDVWIETAAGNLFRASHTDRIAVRTTPGTGLWEVSVGASASSAVFASDFDCAEKARSIRNRLAVGMHTASGHTNPQLLAYDEATKSVKLTSLTGD